MRYWVALFFVLSCVHMIKRKTKIEDFQSSVSLEWLIDSEKTTQNQNTIRFSIKTLPIRIRSKVEILVAFYDKKEWLSEHGRGLIVGILEGFFIPGAVSIGAGRFVAKKTYYSWLFFEVYVHIEGLDIQSSFVGT